MRLRSNHRGTLVREFCIFLTDPPRQDLIDQLAESSGATTRGLRGTWHRFGHANDWQVYLSLTAYLR